MTEGKPRFLRRLREPRVVNTLMTGCIIALGVLYIGQVNASANNARRVSALEDTHRTLLVDAERLDAKIDELRSLDSVMQRQQLLGLVPVDHVDYIHTGAAAVALR